MTKASQTENHQAFYTKYRPQKFKEVIGQDHVTNVLKETIKNGQVAHAYLFSGGRGTGKTSVARILAKEIGTTDKDLYEIDAASNTGVDDIRSLNESVNILPFDSDYKVYILDEVHMLSKSAFNALLKTLEEPPKHIVFILATTEPHKLPETVSSRCESYIFKTPNKSVLKKMIIDVAKNEGYEMEPAVAELIAVLGDGSFRDVHTILQKVIRSSADKKLTIDEVEKVTGSPKSEIVNSVISAVLENKLEEGIKSLHQAEEDNLDPKVLMKLVLEKLRVLLILKSAPNNKKLIEDRVSEDDLEFLEKALKNNSENSGSNGDCRPFNSKVLLRFLEAYDEMLRSYLPYLPIEIALVDCAEKNPD